jgi:fumarate reductase subunit C
MTKVVQTPSTVPVRHTWTPAPLPSFELAVYMCVWIANIIFAFYETYHMTRIYATPAALHTQLVRSHLFEGVWRDGSDVEWEVFTQFAANHLLIALVVHSLVCVLLTRATYMLSSNTQRICMFAIDLALHVFAFEMYAVALVLGVLLLSVPLTRAARSSVPVWVCTILLLANMDYVFADAFDDVYRLYRVRSLLFAYKMVQCISYAARYVERKAWNDESVAKSCGACEMC